MPDSFDTLSGRILSVRGLRVVLDTDLAILYGVPTFRLNEAVKRNAAKFPADFRFRLTAAEFEKLKSKIAVPNGSNSPGRDLISSQFAMTSRKRGAAYLPWAFTEHGALMAANVLRSPRAVKMAIYVVRAFVKQRETRMANNAIFRRLAEIDKTLIEHDGALQVIWRKLQPLLAPPPEKPKRRIGFMP